MNNKLKNGIFGFISISLLLLILIAINLLTSLLPSGLRRIDMTHLGLSDLSQNTGEFLKKLEYDITIAHIYVAGEEDAVVSDLLEKYDEISDHIKVVKVDPAVSPTFVSRYTDKKLQNNSVIVISDKRSKAVDYSDLFIYSLFYTDSNGEMIPQGDMSYSDFLSFFDYYSSYFGTYYTYETLFNGESAVTSAIDYAVSDNLPAVYTLTGHGESPLPDILISDLYGANIDCRDCSISYGDIPQDAGCVIINAPSTDLSESETKKLNEYIRKGGNIFFLSDPEELGLVNLMSLMNEYGLKAVDPGYVCESSNYIGQVYMVIADGSGASEALGITGYSAVLPLPHAIDKITRTTERAVAYTDLFTSSDEAFLVEELNDGESESGYDPEEKGKYTLGVLATVEADKGSSHIAWVSTPGFINEDINRYSTGGNFIYFMSIIESITSKGSTLALDPKKMVEDSLMMSSGQSYFWTVMLCVIIPLAVFVSGMMIIRRRRKR